MPDDVRNQDDLADQLGLASVLAIRFGTRRSTYEICELNLGTRLIRRLDGERESLLEVPDGEWVIAPNLSFEYEDGRTWAASDLPFHTGTIEWAAAVDVGASTGVAPEIVRLNLSRIGPSDRPGRPVPLAALVAGAIPEAQVPTRWDRSASLLARRLAALIEQEIAEGSHKLGTVLPNVERYAAELDADEDEIREAVLQLHIIVGVLPTEHGPGWAFGF